MDKEDVQAIVEEDEGVDEEDAPPVDSGSGGKLPSGTPLGNCGCWGGVNPGHLQPHPSCKSGYARPSACPAICPSGGYMWQGVCT